jgi:MATE family multidrug resistance protein
MIYNFNIIQAAFFLISDGFNCVGGGILRAIGHQKVGATLNITGYYFIGIPTGLYLAFKQDWGLPGLWVGHPLASGLVSLCEAVWIYWLDWGKEAELASERLSDKNEEHRRLLDSCDEDNGYDSI